jgi:hypothetical protein
MQPFLLPNLYASPLLIIAPRVAPKGIADEAIMIKVYELSPQSNISEIGSYKVLKIPILYPAANPPREIIEACVQIAFLLYTTSIPDILLITRFYKFICKLVILY